MTIPSRSALHPYFGVAFVLHDPDDAGGFPTGARLFGIWPTLRLGNFSTGTTLKMTDGHIYRVRGAAGSEQRLERVR